MTRIALLAAAVVLSTSALSAQQLAGGLAGGYNRRVVVSFDNQSSRMTQTRQGQTVAADGYVRIGRIVIAASYLQWWHSDSNENRMRVSTISVRFRPTSWLELGPEVIAYRSRELSTVTLQQSLGGNVSLAIPMGAPGLTAFGTLTVYPPVSSIGHSSVGGGRGIVGVRLSPLRTPLEFNVSYRHISLNRIWEQQNTEETTMLYGLTVGVRLRLGK